MAVAANKLHLTHNSSLSPNAKSVLNIVNSIKEPVMLNSRNSSEAYIIKITSTLNKDQLIEGLEELYTRSGIKPRNTFAVNHPISVVSSEVPPMRRTGLFPYEVIIDKKAADTIIGKFQNNMMSAEIQHNH